MDNETLSCLYHLARDLMESLRLRATVLERISALQPVGRRALSQRLKVPEREVRSICDALKDDGYLAIGQSGMSVSEKGVAFLPALRELTQAMNGITSLERSLSRALNVGRVCIVAGDADSDPDVLREAGRAAARHLIALLKNGMTLTVSGGTSVAAVAGAMPHGIHPLDVHVLPARGGMGMAVETQAGTLAAEIAHALGGRHSLLHVPDSVSQDALQALLKLPEVSEPIRALHHTDVLLYGIGRAEVMAHNRSLPEAEISSILSRGAVGEAVGNYFDAAGRLVYEASEIGLNGEELRQVPHIVAIAVGRVKARAVLAVMRHHHHELLVLDEGAAREILSLL